MSYKTNTYFRLLEALTKPGCAICRFAEAALRQYIDDLFSEHLWVMERREEMRAARGFCAAHAPLIDDYGRVLGIAVLHHDIVGSVLRALEATVGSRPTQRGAISAIADALGPAQECIFCRYSHEQELFAARTLLHDWQDEKMRAAFATSSGLCLPHFRLALEQRESPEHSRSELIEIQLGVLRRLHADLAEFVRKSNLAYADEAAGQEADSPRRALALVSGRVTGVDSRDGRRR
jgi:hypothetical protein